MSDNKQTKNQYATVSLILGIISIALPWFGISSIFALASGIIGIIMAVKARKEDDNSIAKAGMVTSIIGLCLSGLIFVSCVCCAGLFTIIGASMI